MNASFISLNRYSREVPNEALYYNAVAVALHGDPHTIRNLAYVGSWKTAYEMLLTGSDPVPDAESAGKVLARHAIRVVFASDQDFPPLLREITPAPLALYVRGAISHTAAPAKHAIAIVGTRRATPDGKRFARLFGHELAAAGFTIVSGLALGIDASAHEGALEVSGGACIAVLANGLDHVYPENNRRLAEKIIAAGGAIISEYPPGERPWKHRFLERNRIVSGIPRGTLVIEAPESSGSLATASFALEQNRDVFVVPGSITHPNFRGANALIRQGAELVTKSDDILTAYGIEKSRAASNRMDATTPEEKLIVAALTATSHALDVDKIIATTKLEPRIVNQTLTLLLLRGAIRETGGQYTI